MLRNFILFLACGVCITSLAVLSGCFQKKDTPHQTFVYVADVSEAYMAHPTLSEVQSLSYVPDTLNYEDNGYGELFRSVQVSEFSIPKVQHAELPRLQNKWFSSQPTRFLETIDYWAQVDSFLQENKLARMSRSQTVLYEVVASELTLLSESNSTSKRAVISSDFMQKNDKMNMYSLYPILQTNPDGVEKLFNENYPLPTLTGITVYLYYAPPSLEKEYPLAIQFFAKILRSKGATVYVTSHLTKQTK